MRLLQTTARLQDAAARPLRPGLSSKAKIHSAAPLPHRSTPVRSAASTPPPSDPRPQASTPSTLLPKLPLALLGLGGLMGTGFDLAGPGSVLEALGVLAAVVGVHETGHFLAARLQDIHVSKFAIGFGPTLLKYQGAEVEYSLRAFPLGGFVSFPDDDPDSPFDPEDPNLLRNRPVLDRAIVTSAGVIANVIFAYAICVVQAGTVGITVPTYLPGVRLGTIGEGTVAEKAGLKFGDIVLSVGDLKPAPAPGAVDAVVRYIQSNPKKTMPVQIEREGRLETLEITPAEMPDGTGRIGVSLAANVKVAKKKAGDVGAALVLGAEDFNQLLSTVVKGLSQFVSNFGETAQKVSGPVAILAVGSEVARTDINGLYQFAALINLNLAVVNVLPLPALDGWSLVLLGFEAVSGRALNRDAEAIVNYLGFAALVLAGIYLFTRDLEQLAASLFGVGTS